MLCLQSDNKNNHEKELICFKLDLILGYRKEKILRIKDDLIQEFNSKNDELKKIEDSEKKDKLLEKISNISNEIYSIKLSLFDVCPFTCNQIELRNNVIDLNERKLMDKFNIIFEYNTLLKYHNENFSVFYSIYSDVTKINLKLTYRVNDFIN